MTNIEISIIIATRNRESILWESVGKALTAIDNQKAEIIIVNDGDNDLSIPSQYQTKVKILNNFKRGVSKARNLGAENAFGSILFFIDDDMWINKEIIQWIEKSLLKNKKEEAVFNVNWEYPPELNKQLKETKVGRFLVTNGYNTMWGRMKQKGRKPPTGLYQFDVIGSCSFIISKKTFKDVGGYKDSIIFQGEDIEISSRLNHFQIPIYCLFGITLFHNHKDRIDTQGFLKRVERGYQSQFIAERKKLIPVNSNYSNKSRLQFLIYDFFLSSERTLISLLKILPNNLFFEPLTNRLIGLLSGLAKYKQWKNSFTLNQPFIQNTKRIKINI